MIDPRGLSVFQWCDFAAMTLSSYGNVPTLKQASDWVDWANSILMIPILNQYSPPDPRHFTEWNDWAERFVEVVPL